MSWIRKKPDRDQFAPSSDAEQMSRTRLLSLITVGLLFSLAVLAPPHTVHHGPDVVDPNECPVLATAHQTNIDLPETPSVPILLLSTHDAPIFELFSPETPARRAYRSRAPPLSIPA